MPHFFINSKNISDNLVTIDDEENYRHIARALRARTGETLLLIDENQMRYETVIERITGDKITASVIRSYKSERSLPFNLYLAQVPLRSDAQSIIIEKASELGVAGVYPIFSDNCAISRSIIDKKIQKWQKIMFEASKQCERADIPTCFELTSINELVDSGKFDHVVAFCERIADDTFKDYYLTHSDIFNSNNNILVIIGPEGGFSDREFDYFKSKSVPMLTLGNLILKAETAVVVALGNIIYEYNNNRKN